MKLAPKARKPNYTSSRLNLLPIWLFVAMDGAATTANFATVVVTAECVDVIFVVAEAIVAEVAFVKTFTACLRDLACLRRGNLILAFFNKISYS